VSPSSVRVAGQGPTLIMLHGVGLKQSIWEAQVEFLSATIRVVTYDLLGHGRTMERGAALSNWTAQLEGIVQELALEHFLLLGFSFGGMVAQSYAARHPERIDRLILMCTVYDRSDAERAGVLARLELAKKEVPAAIIAAALARWFSPDVNPQVLAHYDALLRGNESSGFLAAYACFAESDLELKGLLVNFRRPTLVIAGDRDSGSTPLMAQKLAGVIRHGECYIVPRTRHMMAVETPDEVNAVLFRFLRETTG